MMRINDRCVTWAAKILLAAVVLGGAHGADRLQAEENSPRIVTMAEFEKLHRRLTQMSTERVWSIPWRLSVRKARERAAKERKPVFLWISSNGGTHPLGPC